MYKKIIIGIGILLCITLIYYVKNPLTAKVEIRGVTYKVDVVVSDTDKERGLGGRDYLPSDKGMFFPYDHAEKFSFWMKGMKFPIDIIWIRDNQIVDISKNVPVESDSDLTVYSPKEPVNKVLEVNAGESDAHGFAVGDLVHIKN